MNLNGWKRIGIVASVVWIVGAGVRTLNVEQNNDIKTASSLTLNCEQAQGMRWSAECDALSTDYLNATYANEWIDTAIVAFVPVPVGWGLVYLILFLVGWVKRGFMEPQLK